MHTLRGKIPFGGELLEIQHGAHALITGNRHEEDGCPRRFELMHQTLPPETASKAIGNSDVLHNQQSSNFGIHSSSPISPMTQTTPLFKDESFPVSPTGY